MNCPDCDVEKGEYHQPGCDMEQCSKRQTKKRIKTKGAERYGLYNFTAPPQGT